MADPMDTLKSILGDDAEDKIRDVMGSLSENRNGIGSSFGQDNNSSRLGNSNNFSAENLQYLMQLRDIASKLTNSHDDVRSNLLLSLKPYMRENRKKSIDSAVKLLNISKLTGLFRI